MCLFLVRLTFILVTGLGKHGVEIVVQLVPVLSQWMGVCRVYGLWVYSGKKAKEPGGFE